MEIFKTRYQAEKERKTSEWHNGSEKIVKVEGGYTLMSEEDYRIWKLQK